MNEHWKLIQSGSIVISTTPDQLWDAACRYFEWCDENMIVAKKTLQSGKEAGKKVEVEFRRPYTIEGFCLQSGLTKRWIMDLAGQYGKDSLWYLTAEKIMSIIYTQNIEGAIVDQFNPIVVSKLLNLDKPQEEDTRTVRVEIVDSRKSELPNNENDILKNLDFNAVQQFRNKVADKEHSTDKEHSK